MITNDFYTQEEQRASLYYDCVARGIKYRSLELPRIMTISSAFSALAANTTHRRNNHLNTRALYRLARKYATRYITTGIRN